MRCLDRCKILKIINDETTVIIARERLKSIVKEEITNAKNFGQEIIFLLFFFLDSDIYVPKNVYNLKKS